MAVVITGNNTPTAGGVTYGDGTTYATTSAGSSGQALLSAGAGAPTWGTPASATTATNLAGGSAGTVPYQSAAGTTAMLAAGTSGYVLQSNGAAAPSWVAPSTGAMTLISTAVASSSASIDFTGLTSAYTNYMVIVDNFVPSANGAGLQMRTSTNNGASYDSGANNYFNSGTSLGSNTYNANNFLDSVMVVCPDGTDSTTNQGGVSMVLTIYNPSGAQRTQVSGIGFNNGITYTGAVIMGGTRLLTSGATNAIRFLTNSGTIKVGTFKLYGIS